MRTSPSRRFGKLLAGLALLGSANAGAALVYDASLNTLPGSQGWTSSIAAGVTSTASGGVYSLDTSGSLLNQSGHIRVLAAQSLDTQGGFELGIGLKVLGETHTSTDRSGFSLLLVGDTQSHALELGFWTDSIWSYAINNGAFVRVPGAAASTTGFHDYRVRVQNNAYQLFQDDALILSGGLVDYPSSLSNPLTLIYDSPNTLFFGDDTSRASSSVQIKYVSLGAVPIPAALFLFAPAAGALVSFARRR
jgi:hypothetical protein